MYSQTKIAIPIFQKDCKSVIEVANDCIKKGADVLEFRIDGLKNPDINEIKDTINEINFPMIATNRINTEGGSFKGSEEERFNILYQCADLVDYVDIELQSNDEYIKKIHDTGVKTIVSYHDFEKTPKLSEITYIVEKEQELGDIAKVAFMPQNLEDTITILAVLSHCEDTIAISMGDLGSYTRVMASKFNSPITFAAGTDVTAPGQIDIETMKALLNMDLNIMDE
ncbi:type I 3-dehydroquinate dehydratase [uncultured Methanobrevibacter sp.]|uniref:type I 3-dehydroquinate dehydratase n=1 Tax=uncultured Methanobrevibacter sp. TaxID=253161 RepID=UPI0025FB20D4|nr:type I 3-dehydroquinate dehydratase [uncultured Methanobrevibacter sp.]